MQVRSPENRKKVENPPSDSLFRRIAELKKQTDAEAHQIRIPMFETTPVNGFPPSVRRGSAVNLSMGTPVRRLTNRTRRRKDRVEPYNRRSRGREDRILAVKFSSKEFLLFSFPIRPGCLFVISLFSPEDSPHPFSLI